MANRTDLFVHLVWSTRHRLPLVDADVEARLYAEMAGRCRGLRCTPLAIGGMPDHVHLLASLHPTVSVAGLAKDVKGASAHFVQKVLRPDIFFQWQSGYGAFTVSRSDLTAVQRYIAEQKAHHANGHLIPAHEPQD